jgi:large subunit ribosomal protein L24
MAGIRKGDRVRVIAGDDKGATGEVLAVFPETGKVTVQGVNIVRHYVKDRYDPRTGNQIKGGVVSTEAPIHISNVQLVTRDAKGKEVLTRIGSERQETTKARPDGSTYVATRGVRVARKTGEEII